MTESTLPERADTGIAGLDDVLQGGWTPGRMYVLEGNPGAGKTTMAVQFLLAGVARGEPGLFISLSETAEELHSMAAEHGWSLDGITILELVRSEDALNPDAQYTMFHPSEVELTETSRAIVEAAERLKAVRVVFDSLSEFRLLAQEPLRFRRQLVALKRFFSRLGSTVILVEDLMGARRDMHLESQAHGVVSLEHRTPDYGVTRRRMQVLKLRGRQYREGHHDFRIRRGGIDVFPRLVAAETRDVPAHEPVRSGLASLDRLLGGGLTRGTSTLIVGPAGAGKSTLATQYCVAAGARGERADVFLFDESPAIFQVRNQGLGLDTTALVRDGMLAVHQVDPAELPPGQFAHLVRQAAERDGAKLVVIDSLNGYIHSMPNEQFLALHLHELLAFLGQRGVTTILIMAQHGMVGASGDVPIDASYLADTVVLLRFFETRGEVRQAISVIKKRTGEHERSIRELWLSREGIKVGEPLREFTGVLTGFPLMSTPDDIGKLK